MNKKAIIIEINQIGNAAASRVYVLDSDIQNYRERDVRLKRAARLGTN